MSSNNTVSTASNNTAAASNNAPTPAPAPAPANNNATLNNANTPATATASAPAPTSEPANNTKVSQMVNKGKEIVKNNSTIIITVVVIYLVIMTAYFLSKTYRVRNTYEKLNKYENYLMLTDKFLKEKNRGELPLKEFMVASSYRGYMGKYQILEYCSIKLLKKTIQSGARFLYMDIFNDTLDEFASPIISSGIERGNWKLTFNTETFEDVCKTIKDTAFNAGHVDNPDDPLFLAINLKVNKNAVCLNKIKKLLYKYFRRELLGPEFSYMRGDLPNTPMKKLRRKVVIFASGGAEGSTFEELINYSWDNDENNFRKISYRSLDKKLSSVDTIKLNPQDVREYNKTGFTLIVPEENGFFTRNYDPTPYLKTGCQFICMNYQKVDNYMSKYVTSYRYSSFKKTDKRS